jgi:hypothetical protein
MNALTPLRGGTIPAAFQSRTNLPDMTGAMQAGLSAGFAVIGYRGKTWRIKFRGEDKPILDGAGRAMNDLNVVIVGVSDKISKQWYAKRYNEGDNEAPDCFSINGEHPDPASPHKQCDSCAACPQNIWGSRITEQNKKAKACQDSKRLAIVPWGDHHNTEYGGPMLLRLPPMSLANLSRYASELKRYGGQPFMAATRLSFDLDKAHPLIKFEAIGWLTDEEAIEINEVLDDPQIDRILHSELETTADPEGEEQVASALAGSAPASTFIPPVQQAPEPAPAPAPQPVAPPPPPPAPEPAPPPPPPPAPAPEPAQAAAKPTPFTQSTAPATVATFGGAQRRAQIQMKPPAPPVAATATVAAASPLATPATGTAAVVSGAPPDMNAAIDNLLDSDDD